MADMVSVMATVEQACIDMEVATTKTCTSDCAMSDVCESVQNPATNASACATLEQLQRDASAIPACEYIVGARASNPVSELNNDCGWSPACSTPAP